MSPYIKKERRVEILTKGFVENAGELNFCITNICTDYVELHGLNYRTLNDVIGALECAKQEFYRRVATPYEERKRAENGDVYPKILTGEGE